MLGYGYGYGEWRKITDNRNNLGGEDSRALLLFSLYSNRTWSDTQKPRLWPFDL
jgi:hypothetical protein